MPKGQAHATPIYRKGDVNLCMVVGCGRKAVYRNAISVRRGGTIRGYCVEHKQLAVPVRSAQDRTVNEAMQDVEFWEHNPSPEEWEEESS